jgi:hypothetical protein
VYIEICHHPIHLCAWTKRARYRFVICCAVATVLTIALTVAVQSSQASTINDARATRALVAAQYTVTRVMRANLRGGLTAVDALVEGVQRECPDAGSQAPPSALGQAQKLVRQMAGTLLVALLHNDRYAIHRFEHTVTRLRWSRRKFTNRIESEARKLEDFSNLRIVEPCADVQVWASTHFERLPMWTMKFDRELTADENSVEQSGLSLVQPYEDSKTRALARRTLAMRRQFDRDEGKHTLRAVFALVWATFGRRCKPNGLCLPFQVLTPGELEHGQSAS